MIHKFDMQGTHIVLDVNSGAVHILDEMASRVLSCYDNKGNMMPRKIKELKEKYSGKEVDEAKSELDLLISKGLLFSADPYKDIFLESGPNTVVKALCLHIAHDCNLRCRYCFAGKGDYNGERGKMSVSVGKKAIDFVINSSGNRRNIEIDFFGGEPLLNLDTVKEIVEYAREKEKEFNKHFRFTITTNGILLNDSNMDYLNDTMDNIVLSIDGRKEVNDEMRVRVDGSGCYKDILPKFQKLASIRGTKDYYVRGTYTARNLDFSNDVLHLAEKGFDQISIEPVVLPDGSGIEIKKEHLPALFCEYEKLAAALLKHRRQGSRVNFFHFMLDLEAGPCIIKRLKGCGAGSEYLAVTPDGGLYPCHQFANNTEYKLGDVFNGINRYDIVNEFNRINVYAKEKCRDCWAKFYCSGGCTANAWQFHNKLDDVYEIGCELQKKRIECALWLKAESLNQAADEKCG
ncbi:MAG: thioether cross-link-forming SCIFF peptide maturase [Bacillota bacterium]|jgi:uncharacterized protein|nr:thioether cross-link-forming SCIFF peptide maturase [Bacillota bacterium]NLV62882.1 thioether cross-link-forming SCIFF peptide maturase [Clostridiaceae bacterium]